MTLEIQVLAWEGESVCTSVRGPATQEGVRESLKGPITLVIHVLFWLFDFFGGIFNSNPQIWERSQPVHGAPK